MNELKSILIPCDPGRVSDGYHTFDELYAHRNALFVSLMNSHPGISWWAERHDDGSRYEGWFIAGMHLPSGDISYHLPLPMRELIDRRVRRLEFAPKWDGYTARDVEERLNNWTKTRQK